MRRLSTTPTKLELSVLADVFGGQDPWGKTRSGSRAHGTRVISQALARLERKGLVERIHPKSYVEAVAHPTKGYIVTHAGMRVIESGLSDS